MVKLYFTLIYPRSHSDLAHHASGRRSTRPLRCRRANGSPPQGSPSVDATAHDGFCRGSAKCPPVDGPSSPFSRKISSNLSTPGESVGLAGERSGPAHPASKVRQSVGVFTFKVSRDRLRAHHCPVSGPLGALHPLNAAHSTRTPTFCTASGRWTPR